MELTEIQTAVQQLPSVGFDALTTWLVGERARREQAAVTEAAKLELMEKLQEEGKLETPDAISAGEDMPTTLNEIPEWSDPGTTFEKMYRLGDVVRHNGRVVRSTHPGLNHWEPGVLGFDGRIWLDITAEVTPAVEPETPVEPVEPTEPDTPEVPTEPAAPVEPPAPAFPEFTPGIAVKKGDIYAHGGELWEVVQPHVTAAHWPPSAVPALWKKYTPKASS